MRSLKYFLPAKCVQSKFSQRSIEGSVRVITYTKQDHLHIDSRTAATVVLDKISPHISNLISIHPFATTTITIIISGHHFSLFFSLPSETHYTLMADKLARRRVGGRQHSIVISNPFAHYEELVILWLLLWPGHCCCCTTSGRIMPARKLVESARSIVVTHANNGRNHYWNSNNYIVIIILSIAHSNNLIRDAHFQWEREQAKIIALLIQWRDHRQIS